MNMIDTCVLLTLANDGDFTLTALEKKLWWLAKPSLLDTLLLRWRPMASALARLQKSGAVTHLNGVWSVTPAGKAEADLAYRHELAKLNSWGPER